MIDQFNYINLESRNLEFGEVIVFPIYYKGEPLQYVTCKAWLSPTGELDCPENQIFIALQEFGETRDFDTYLSDLYGYPCRQSSPDSTVWRECNTEDYAALSRVVYDIFEKLADPKDIEKISLTNITVDFMNYGN